MCMPKAPKIDMPAPVAPPPEQQESKTPNMAGTRRKDQKGNIAGGTLLTGGTAAAPANTGAASLLGQ